MTGQGPLRMGLVRKGKKNSGFTLLELIVVMLLISIIFGIAGVVFSGRLSSSRFDAAVRELTATMRHARALSRITGEKQTFSLNLDSKRYGIAGKGEKGFSPDIRIRVADPLTGETDHGRYDFLFYPAGNADGGTILLSDEKRKAEIALDPVVGAVATR